MVILGKIKLFNLLRLKKLIIIFSSSILESQKGKTSTPLEVIEFNYEMPVNMKNRIKELLQQLKNNFDNKLSVPNPKIVASEILLILNSTPLNNEKWLEDVLDELALIPGDKKLILHGLCELLLPELQEISRQFFEALKECRKIEKFYKVVLNEEITWKENIKDLLQEMQQLPPDIVRAESLNSPFTNNKDLDLIKSLDLNDTTFGDETLEKLAQQIREKVEDIKPTAL